MQMLGGIVAAKALGGNSGPSDATAYKTAGQGQQQQQSQFGISSLMPPNPPTGVDPTAAKPGQIASSVPGLQSPQSPQGGNSFVQQLMQRYMQ